MLAGSAVKEAQLLAPQSHPWGLGAWGGDTGLLTIFVIKANKDRDTGVTSSG